MDYFHQDKGHQGIASIDAGCAQAIAWASARYDVLEKFVFSKFAVRTIIEIGCLEGFLVSFLIARGFEVVGYDINDAVVNASSSYNKLPLYVADIESEPLMERDCDLAISFHTFEHIHNLEQGLRNTIDCLKPEGHIFLEVPSSPAEIHNPDHFHNFSDTSLRLFTEKYFRTVKIYENVYLDIHGAKHRSLYCHAWHKR